MSQQNSSASLAMTFPFHGCGERLRFGRWWLGLFLLGALGFSGCKTWGSHEEGLRESDLAEPARQARSRAEPSSKRDSKAVDDPWMSEKAQKIARDLQ
jgi:hypothetical protein